MNYFYPISVLIAHRMDLVGIGYMIFSHASPNSRSNILGIIHTRLIWISQQLSNFLFLARHFTFSWLDLARCSKIKLFVNVKLLSGVQGSRTKNNIVIVITVRKTPYFQFAWNQITGANRHYNKSVTRVRISTSFRKAIK